MYTWYVLYRATRDRECMPSFLLARERERARARAVRGRPRELAAAASRSRRVGCVRQQRVPLLWHIAHLERVCNKSRGVQSCVRCPCDS